MSLRRSNRSSANFMTTKMIVCMAALTVLSCISLSPAYAVSISAYRIYLDEENRDTSFIIFNRDVSHQECKLSLIHNSFNENSQLIHLPHGTVPENSAKDWIRYSPRKFILTPAQSQTVRFTMRRKANAGKGEYRSYLLIDCGVAEIDGQKQAQVNLQTKLVHSVPIIVRSGKLDVNVKFEDFKLTQNGLEFSLRRIGDRSVYGDMEVVDKNTNQTLFMQRNFSIYPESDRYLFSSGIKTDLKNLKFRYIENKEFGGDIVLEQDGQNIQE